MFHTVLDQPKSGAPVGETFHVRGWVFSEDGLITSATASITDREFPVRIGLPRPDVLAAHPQKCRNQFVGFDGTVNLRGTGLTPGIPAELTLRFQDAAGESHEITVEVAPESATPASIVKPLTHGFDLPAPDQAVTHTLAVEGWVISRDRPVDRVILTTASQSVELSCGWPRPDVATRLNLNDSSASCGFKGFLIPTAPGPLPYEVTFFSGDTQLGTHQAQAVVGTADPVTEDSLPMPARHMTGLPERYVDLLIKTLNGSIYSDAPARSDGRDWPGHAHTMAGMKRLEHLRRCVETVLHDGIPGDFIETGVWKGGSCILMRGILKAWADAERTVWLADSFQGLPKPEPTDHPLDDGDSLHIHQELVIPLEQVKANFRSYDLLDDRVRFLPGWFCDTLPSAPIEQLAILRLDGDMYESTIDALDALYVKLQPGGFCIIDDYGCIPACRAAVHDFRARHGIREPIHGIDWTGAFWRKQS